MSKKWKNLQPWLDYFKMLQTYKEKGLLQMEAAKHEAYVTVSAFNVLANADRHDSELERLKEYAGVFRRIRAYAAWMSRDGMAYMDRPFALHVVKDDSPHDLLTTMLITRRRKWWALWRKVDDIDVIDYSEQERP